MSQISEFVVDEFEKTYEVTKYTKNGCNFSSKCQLLAVKSLINEQGGYVVFLALSEYSFIRDFRVLMENIFDNCYR